MLSGQQRNSRGYSQVSSDDEPLYDSVASDEDYSSIDTQSIKSAKEEMKKDRPADVSLSLLIFLYHLHTICLYLCLLNINQTNSERVHFIDPWIWN